MDLNLLKTMLKKKIKLIIKNIKMYDERTKQYSKTDKNKEYRRIWAKNKYNTNEEHRKISIDKAVKYERKMLNGNIEYKINILKSRIRNALKTFANKYRNTNDLTIIMMEELKIYLENQFKRNDMENHGSWHIDHIKPCCSFDLTKEESRRVSLHKFAASLGGG